MVREARRFSLFLGLAFLLCGFLLAVACADDNEDNHSKGGFGPVDNPTYKGQCATCHVAYHPALLPSGSWCKILSGLDNHNDENLSIDAATKKTILEYLENNAAEHSSAKRAAKIIRSLNGQTPERITEVPYIKRKHHEVSEEIFSRESIRSFSNCDACHSNAEQGVYDEDSVSIPN